MLKRICFHFLVVGIGGAEVYFIMKGDFSSASMLCFLVSKYFLYTNKRIGLLLLFVLGDVLLCLSYLMQTNNIALLACVVLAMFDIITVIKETWKT